MLSRSDFYPYQERIIQHLLDHPFAMVWAGMGLGKTGATETAILELQDRLQVTAALVVAPVRVIQSVWRQEGRKWEHLTGLRFSLIHGTAQQRIAALKRKADIYLVNYENLAWLSTQVEHLWLRKKLYPPFSMVVYDEVTKVKNSQAQRSKAWRKMLPYLPRRVGLTGEPAANGYKDLHGQYLMVDGGQRLGTSLTQFRERYLRPMGYGGYNWIATRTGQEEIHRKISDITIELSAEDYLDLPPVVNNVIWVDLPPKTREVYDQLEKEFFAELASGVELEVLNEASKINKLLQIASGAAYFGDAKQWEEIHRVKLEALQEVIDESAGRPLLVGYTYRHEAARIAQTWPEKPQTHEGASFLSSHLGERMIEDIIRRWEFDEIPLLCGHPACLHPSTEVLTETRGWRRIVDVLPWERVFDGVEFVHHSGCYLSGHKAVIEVFGLWMTPDHKLWVNGRWEEAASVRDRPGARSEALYEHQGNDQSLGEMFEMWSVVSDAQTERGKTQSSEANALRPLRRGPLSPHDRYSDLEDLARVEDSLRRDQSRQGPTELPRARHRGMRALAKVREFLLRYAGGICGRLDYRENRQRGSVFPRELSMGYPPGAAGKQAQQPLDYLPGGTDPSGRVLPTDRYEQRKADRLSQPGDDRGRGSAGSTRIPLQPRATEKIPVYDIVDCGPRHSFVVRNARGECFLSHNSMGHGLNLQNSSARAVVWFSLPWSLELYLQLNARLFGGHRRQGASVVHHILARDTVDEIVWAALENKNTTQAELKHAVKTYWEQRR